MLRRRVWLEFEGKCDELGAKSWELGARSYELGAGSLELEAVMNPKMSMLKGEQRKTKGLPQRFKPRGMAFCGPLFDADERGCQTA